MVKILNKKKKEVKKVIAGGRIIIINFNYLNPDDFNYCVKTKEELQEQLALLSPDGKLFVNSTQEGHEMIADIFKILIPETKQTLNEYIKIYKKQYYYIKTFDDWAKMQADDKERIYALTMLLIPIEMKRREAEWAYYLKKWFKNNLIWIIINVYINKSARRHNAIL